MTEAIRTEMLASEPVAMAERAAQEARDWLDKWGRHMAAHEPEELELTRSLVSALGLVETFIQRKAERLAEVRAAREQAEEREAA